MNVQLNRGFSLVEILIVVGIMAVLASIAYPSYLDSVRKSRRADAMTAINNIQLAQEKLRASCRFYAQNLGGANNNCGASAAASTIQAPTASADGYYTLALTNASATGYTVTAKANDTQAKDNEGGTICTMVLTVNAANPTGLQTPAECWD